MKIMNFRRLRTVPDPFAFRKLAEISGHFDRAARSEILDKSFPAVQARVKDNALDMLADRRAVR